ncbi:MAG: RING finger protein [Actinomycetota bacterium]|nr:RING finger protein [Actinomycetota bacterium]
MANPINQPDAPMRDDDSDFAQAFVDNARNRPVGNALPPELRIAFDVFDRATLAAVPEWMQSGRGARVDAVVAQAPARMVEGEALAELRRTAVERGQLSAAEAANAQYRVVGPGMVMRELAPRVPEELRRTAVEQGQLSAAEANAHNRLLAITGVPEEAVARLSAQPRNSGMMLERSWQFNANGMLQPVSRPMQFTTLADVRLGLTDAEHAAWEAFVASAGDLVTVHVNAFLDCEETQPKLHVWTEYMRLRAPQLFDPVAAIARFPANQRYTYFQCLFESRDGVVAWKRPLTRKEQFECVRLFRDAEMSQVVGRLLSLYPLRCNAVKDDAFFVVNVMQMSVDADVRLFANMVSAASVQVAPSEATDTIVWRNMLVACFPREDARMEGLAAALLNLNRVEVDLAHMLFSGANFHAANGLIAQHNRALLARTERARLTASLQAPVEDTTCNADAAHACIACNTNARAVLLLPCRHLAMCGACHTRAFAVKQTCAVCRAAIERTEAVRFA